MKLYATIEDFQEFDKVTYYTIRYEYKDEVVDEETETDKFLKKFNTDEYKEPIEIILNTIVQIGKRGAKAEYFRFENLANALPPTNQYLSEFQLLTDETSNESIRLYCIRLSESIVILLNGGIKTTHKAQQCPNVAVFFRDANKIAQLVDEAIKEGEIILEEKAIRIEEDFLLYL